MMVNGLKPDPHLWKGTVPDQMPWMSSYEPSSMTLQFGHQQMRPTQQHNVILQQPANFVSTNAQNPSLHPIAINDQSVHPISTCPISYVSNAMFTSGPSITPDFTTSTAQYYLSPQVSASNPCLHPGPIAQPTIGAPRSCFDASNSLTLLPGCTATQPNSKVSHKRSSMELDEDASDIKQPPTKQLLSENKLFKKFGSLQIDGAGGKTNSEGSGNSSDSSDDCELDDRSPDKGEKSDELNKYVYLLFKDNRDNLKNIISPTNDAIDRLARNERDKMSKALILWTPPLKDTLFGGNQDDDSDEDEEFRYKDHKDFLKNRSDSITITEVTDYDCNNSASMTGCDDCAFTNPDDLMMD